MPRYIDASKIRIIAQMETVDGDALVSLADVRRAIEQTPTADVVEVKHGYYPVIMPTRRVFHQMPPRSSAKII